MKTLNLEQMGVREMDAKEVKETDGGHMVGYSKWYKQQQLDRTVSFWTWFMFFNPI